MAAGPHKYIKFRRRMSDWAIVGVGAQKMDDGQWRIGITNAAPTPVRASGVEQALLGGAGARGRRAAGDGRAGPGQRPARQRGVQDAPGAGADQARDRAGKVEIGVLGAPARGVNHGARHCLLSDGCCTDNY